jgi:sensor histidine kinase regulating citrate/malate metabolism
MADGKLLSFLSPPDIYSLFGNILDNAIESELKEKEEDRYINIVASKHGNLVNIYEENYISDLPTFEDGVPVTDKADKAYHGFGTKSIIYVCEKYNGHVRFSAANHVFSVNILLPLP